MNSQTDVYTAYLADWNVKHPNIVKPVIYQPRVHDDSPEVLEMNRNILSSVKLARKSTYWLGGNENNNVRLMNDGRVVDCSYDYSGKPVYAIFTNEQEAKAYCEPISMRVMFEQW